MDLKKIMEARFKGEDKCPDRLLCLDPGNTTGWALFIDGQLASFGQTPTIKEKGGTNGSACIVDWRAMEELFAITKPTMVVCENYRVYGHKLDRHSFSEVPTIRLIGGIDYLCTRLGIKIHYNMAVNAKGFITDEKLKSWDLYKVNMKHSRDAIRHGIYYLLIDSKKNA